MSFRLHWVSDKPQPASVQSYYAHGESAQAGRSLKGFCAANDWRSCPALFAAMVRVVWEHGNMRTESFAQFVSDLADTLRLSSIGPSTPTVLSSLPLAGYPFKSKEALALLFRGCGSGLSQRRHFVDSFQEGLLIGRKDAQVTRPQLRLSEKV